MQRAKFWLGGGTAVLIVGLVAVLVIVRHTPTGTAHNHSPYAGQETRTIKALSARDIEGLLAGEGTPFGGMAKAAELNGYPGPRHVLDAYNAGDFPLTTSQHERIQALFNEMRRGAIELGEQIIAIEQELDSSFVELRVDQSSLQEHVATSARLYAELRALHLSYHLSMKDILTPIQIAHYNELRGYTNDPCEVPAGHDPELWKLHNGCE